MKAKGNSFTKTAVWGLMGLLILGLGGFGAVNLNGSARTVGEVGDKSISVDDYARELQQQIRAIESQSGEQLSFQEAQAIGLDLTGLAFLYGIIGVGLGFGLQTVVSNLVSGVIILLDKSIKPGDVIAVGDSFGWVNKIGVRAVSVLTREGKEHLIPNEDLMTREVENWSYSNPNVRISIPVGVSYNTDMDQAIELMKQACEDIPRVLSHPKPVCWMLGFGDSSVDFEIRCWIKDPQSGVGNFRAAILKRVWDLFKEHEIEIPFPQRDVHIRTLAKETKIVLE